MNVHLVRNATLTFALLLGLPLFSSAFAADPGQSGEAAFNSHCRTCHSVKPGDNRLGPTLHGILGRKAGTTPGYASYSQALANSGIVWDESTLDKFIGSPEKAIPNNNMKPYSGLNDPAIRKQIIEYLKSQSGGQR